MKTNTFTRGVAAAVATVAATVAPPLAQTVGATEVISDGARMVFAPETNSAWSVYWQTAYTNTVPICWGACPAAASAHLTASCMNETAVTAQDFYPVDTNAAWKIPASLDEDLYTLELRYLNADGETLLTVTSRVARIVGVNGIGARMDFAESEATNTDITAWSRVRRPGASVDNAVIAYDAAWNSTNQVEEILFTAKPIELPSKVVNKTLSTSAGYIGWQLSGQGLPNGWYAVSLEFDDGTLLYQRVCRSAGGTMYSFK